MGKRAKWGFLAAISTVFATAALWIYGPNSAKQILGEYFRPTTVMMMPLPEGCIQSKETPPANLMRIVESQKSFYRLTLQDLVVCRTAKRFPQGGHGIAEAIFSEEVRKRWLPLYVGCCSYQFRRHFAVVVTDARENGSVMVEAALVQSRWDYLWLNWRKDRSYWF